MKKYESIMMYIENLVTTDQLKQGDRLPSIRSVAETFHCNKATVQRAYQALEINHKIFSIPKSGYYLVKNSEYDHNEQLDTIDFLTAMPDPKLLPYREFHHCINRAVELYKRDLFSYDQAQGLLSLRHALVKHFHDYQVFTSEDNIYITSGAQQALSLIAKMPFPNSKKKILVEQPTYAEMLSLVKLNGDELIGIERNEYGIDLHELEKLFRDEDIKFFYTIPRFHNPLGTRYSERTKKKIVALAERYDVYILEDDYLADIDFDKKSQPLYYYDVSDHVLYVKSFSKSYLPGLRLGAVILPAELSKMYLKYKRGYDLNTSVLAQGGLEIYLNSGMYHHHIKKTQRAYRQKMNDLRLAIGYYNQKNIDIYVPNTGFFSWFKLPQHVDMKVLINRLEQNHILISPAHIFYFNEQFYRKGFRICISCLNHKQIDYGVRKIFEVVNLLI